MVPIAHILCRQQELIFHEIICIGGLGYLNIILAQSRCILVPNTPNRGKLNNPTVLSYFSPSPPEFSGSTIRAPETIQSTIIITFFLFYLLIFHSPISHRSHLTDLTVINLSFPLRPCLLYFTFSICSDNVQLSTKLCIIWVIMK